jgi:exocyst complex protein 7
MTPIRETGRTSLAELLEDTRRRVGAIQVLSPDGAAMPITSEIMTRLQSMVDFLRPISSIMISLGDGNWKTVNAASGSLDQVPSLKSFDVGADGRQLFAHYSSDTVDALMTSFDQRARLLLKSKSVIGAFLANNISVVDRMIRNSDLQAIMATRQSCVEPWRKKAVNLYLDPWNEPSKQLMDQQYTNRGTTRPPSGSAVAVDSAAILKGLTSKDKDAIKERFRIFNTSFDELVARHKSLKMDPDVRDMMAKQVQQQMEPLYGRFWDRYHDVDKGKGKYVKYDKGSISAVFLALT